MDTNNKKIVCLLLAILVNIGICYAQFTLEKQYVHMRANDTIVKQEVIYKDPGRSGSDVFWNFGKLRPAKIPYQVCYSGNDTLTIGEEHLTLYTHELNQGDSLFLKEYYSRATRFHAIVPELEFRYPFHYTDSIEGYFYGEGKYSGRLTFISQGRNKIKADAWGTMLLPGNDTLKNVIRICLQKDVCEKISNSDSILLKIHGDSSILSREQIQEHLQNDTVILRMKTYRWYAEGYRYPVFETVSCETFRFGLPVSYYTTAFYYPPEEHIYLENDPLNVELQEALKEKSLSANHSCPDTDKEKPDRPMLSDLSVYYNIYPNPVRDYLTLEYYLSDAAPVSISLFDMGGRLLEKKDFDRQAAGVHTETLPMDVCPKGNYILHLVVADKVYTEKIIKE